MLLCNQLIHLLQELIETIGWLQAKLTDLAPDGLLDPVLGDSPSDGLLDEVARGQLPADDGAVDQIAEQTLVSVCVLI